MALLDLLYGLETSQVLLAVAPLVIGIITTYLFTNRSIPGKTPPLTKGDWPIVGSLGFWTRRNIWFREAAAHSTTGHFSFHVGSYPVIGVTGDAARQTFLESRDLDMKAGYTALLAGSPEPPNPNAERSQQELLRDMAQMIKRENLVKGLHLLISDTTTRLDELVKDPKGLTDPFESIYGMIYHLTMRTVACNEIANDRPLLDKTLRLFEQVEASSTPEVVMFPWLPSPAKLKRLWGGAQLYFIFKNIIDERAKTGHREEDPLQFLIDKGEDPKSVVSFVLGALFAGQLNTGFTAAWVLVYLANDSHWREKVWQEVKAVAEKYDSDSSKSLAERLASAPLDAWENELPTIDICLRDTIRLQTVGALLRQNVSDKAVPLPNDVEVPAGAFAAYPLADIHMDPSIYPNPKEWNPAHHLPGNSADQKRKLTFLGWGAGRHPCLGIRFAKLEQNIITAFFLAYFDFGLSDKDGKPILETPQSDPNAHVACKPKERFYLKYRVRE